MAWGRLIGVIVVLITNYGWVLSFCFTFFLECIFFFFFGPPLSSWHSVDKFASGGDFSFGMRCAEED